MNLKEINEEWSKYKYSYALSSFLIFTTVILFSIFILPVGNFDIIMASIFVFLIFFGYFNPIVAIIGIMLLGIILRIIINYFIFAVKFLIDSDNLFKIIGQNRLYSNIMNIILTLCGLSFISFILIGLEIRQLNKHSKDSS